MEGKQRGDRFMEVEDQFAKYEVYDRQGEKIGKVDDLFVDEHDNPEYIGVKMGFLGMRSTLIPMDVARIDEEGRRIEVSVDKDKAKDGPSFDDDREITPEYENEVRSYYGLSAVGASEQRGNYGEYYGGEERHGGEREGRGAVGSGVREGDTEAGESRGHEREERGAVGPGMREGDTETGEFRGHGREQEGVNQPGDDLEDEDELRVQRVEEELRAGTREREAGRMNVRKRVRTEREQIRVPTKHEEVSVERVPVNEERADAEIGEDEIVVPVTEEEVVTDKRAVVKEEIRLRKDVVEDEEVVEDDVRKEEVDIDDQTTGRGGRPGGTAGRGSDDLEDETRRRNR